MAEKMVIVVSCDLPDIGKREFLENLVEDIRPFIEEHPNGLIWAGLNGSATAVLNVIGVD